MRTLFRGQDRGETLLLDGNKRTVVPCVILVILRLPMEK